MRTPHTSYRKGTKVLVTLRDGEVFIAKFKDKKSSYMFFEGRSRVPISEIQNTGVFKDRKAGKAW